ncbi:MAG TPA: response regulator transcription factor [Anaerolineales bacterium]|nr:response regulator transcription factor [Anaerolineales bacterium]
MSTNQTTITVLIADNHPTTRAGIRSILSETTDIQVIGEAENGFQVEGMVAELRPNILLLDLVMPGLTPAKLEKWVRTHCPETITLVLTAHNRDAYLASMMDAGAAGFLSKTETGERLISAVRQAISGDNLYTAEQFARSNRWRLEACEKWENLTNREQQILCLLTAEGCDNKCIAETLGITVKTAAYHVTNILKKLNVKSRHEAITWAHKYLPDNLE